MDSTQMILARMEDKIDAIMDMLTCLSLKPEQERQDHQERQGQKDRPDRPDRQAQQAHPAHRDQWVHRGHLQTLQQQDHRKKSKNG